MRAPSQRRKRGDQTPLKSALKEGNSPAMGTGAWGSRVPILSSASLKSGTTFTTVGTNTSVGMAPWHRPGEYQGISMGLGNSSHQMQLASAQQQNALSAYVYHEYPKHLHQPDGNFIVVCNALEEQTIRASGVLLLD